MKTLTGTNENSDLHMNGLQQMVAARGGLHKLPTRLRQTLNMYVYRALAHMNVTLMLE